MPFAGEYWTELNLPAENTRATITKAAAGVGKYNICTGLDVIIAAGATAPAAINLQVNLIDGGSGLTTYLWRGILSLPATAGSTSGIARSDLKIVGSLNTEMTLEFSSAGGVNTFESVWMMGQVGD